MNLFLMIVGAFLALLGIVDVITLVVLHIRELFEDGVEEMAIFSIFLIIVGILGTVILLLAWRAEVTAEALDNVHYLFPEVT